MTVKWIITLIIICVQLKAVLPSSVTHCKVDEFSCDNGQCIASIDVCNGISNCADGSDEVSTRCSSLPCPATAFHCAYGACIDGDLQCNGVNNCVDGSDESRSLCSEWPTPLSTSRPTPRPTRRPTTQSTSGRPPVSSSRNCRAPPQPENGHWQLHGSQCSNGKDCNVSEGTELEMGSQLVYSCNIGYKLNGSSNVNCSVEGRLDNIPVCLDIRCKPLSTASTKAKCTYNDEWVSCEYPVLPRTKALLSCRPFYYNDDSDTLSSEERNEVRCNDGQWKPQPIRCVPVCGRLFTDFVPIIIDDKIPNISEFPWHASIYYDHGNRKIYSCGATIIKENLLITTARCVYDEDVKRVIDPNKIFITTGNVYRDYDSSLNDRRLVKKNKVKHIYIKCKYTGLAGNYFSDIAILELVEPFILSTWLTPACLNSLSDGTILDSGDFGKVTRFSETTALNESNLMLQAFRVPYFSYIQCKYMIKNTVDTKFITIDKFCAGLYLNESSVCYNDNSGGGLVFLESDGRWYLQGIFSTSFSKMIDGDFYCNNKYSLYTRISSHIEWIQDVIRKLEQNQSFPLCPNLLK